MKLVDRDETILVIVGGGTEPATDRALAEGLCREITGRGDGQSYRRALLVLDTEFLDRPDLHRHPTISVGGPGVNAVAQRLVGELPMLWEHEDRSFIQADMEGSRRVALWGIDGTATTRAVEAFRLEGFLSALLDQVWRSRPGLMM